MHETKLLSHLLPGHPDYYPIIQNIREKYYIPEICAKDNGITEVLLADENIDWDELRRDIEDHLRANSEILLPGTGSWSGHTHPMWCWLWHVRFGSSGGVSNCPADQN